MSRIKEVPENKGINRLYLALKFGDSKQYRKYP